MSYHNQGDSEPEYLDILSPLDREQYQQLRKDFYTKLNPTNVVPLFSDVLSMIKEYSIRNNEDDGKRCNCCGVCWLPDRLGVNTNRLSYLTGQQKNNINSALMKLMYIPAAFSEELFSQIPELQENLKEKRMWTIRKLSISTPTPMIRTTIITHTQTHIFTSPRPILIRTRTWSYEDYIEPQNFSSSPNFFEDDPYSIPLSSWQDFGEEEGF